MTVDCIHLEPAGPATRIDLRRFDLLHPDGRQLVRGWFNKALTSMQDDGECFEAFIFAWIAVNGWAACVTGRDRDAEYIKALQRSPELRERFTHQLGINHEFRKAAEGFQSYWPIFKAQEIRREGNRAIGLHDRRAIVAHYFSHGLRSFEPECWKAHTDAGHPVPLDWPHTLAAIYRVRCNLFHGEKSAHSEMDSQIVRSALNVLVTYFRAAEIL